MNNIKKIVLYLGFVSCGLVQAMESNDTTDALQRTRHMVMAQTMSKILSGSMSEDDIYAFYNGKLCSKFKEQAKKDASSGRFSEEKMSSCLKM